MSLKGKTAIVTGSTSGIGLGIAKALAAEGVNITLNGFGDEGEIAQIIEAIEAQGVQCFHHGADMTKPDEIEDMVAKTAEKLGSVDILVNNAGIQHVAPIDEFPPEKWNAIININMNAAFHTQRHAIPHMRKAGWGRIINIVSAHGLVASPFKTAYVTAKHGMMGMTKTVALEVAQDNITCNAICPGYVLTPLVEKQIPDTAKARGITEEEVKRDVLLAAHHTKKFTTIEQIAGTALFLCSPHTENMTGSHVTLDGGWSAA